MATTPGYDPKKAALFNQLRQQGLSEDDAIAQAGITDTENYAIGMNGQLGSFVSNSVLGFTPAQLEQNKRDFQAVDYDQSPTGLPAQQRSAKPTTYTTTSTTQVSGGGSTTIIAGEDRPTAASRALQPAIDAKQAEIEQFNKDNPSNFIRRRQGLPPLTPEENQKRNEQALALSQQKVELINQQQSAQEPGTPTIITVPNTTTTATTVTTGTTAVNTPIQAPDGADPAVNQQAEIQLADTTPVATENTTRSPAPVNTGEAAAPPAEVRESVFDPANVDPNTDPFEQRRFELEQEADVPVADIVLTPAELEAANDPFEQRRLELEQQSNRDELAREENLRPTPVDPDNDPAVRDFFEQRRQELETQAAIDDDPDSESNARTKALLKETQEQASIQQYFNQTTKGDWRVRLRIAPDADYLYQDKSNALLAPLRVSDGVVFPYTPIINTSYAAKYDPYDLTHSNYRGYFYKGSQVSDVQIQATFTAQDTREAEYVLAVIQFFRSATKMFYGKDQQRGSPPPLVYLRGYGEYQFNDHACVITNFQYNLPNDVDYIAVTPNNIGLNLSNRQQQVGSSPVSTISSAIGRLSNLFNAVTGQPGVPKGAVPGTRGDLGQTRATVYGLNQATYVPTKIDMNITLLPIQTRSQVSKQFSVKEFSNGNLLKKGFW
jgi:hypothetical protein